MSWKQYHFPIQVLDDLFQVLDDLKSNNLTLTEAINMAQDQPVCRLLAVSQHGSVPATLQAAGCDCNRSETVFRSITSLLRHFLSSALAWRHTSSNSVTHNYCHRARKVTLSFMDTLIALTYLLTYLLTYDWCYTVWWVKPAIRLTMMTKESCTGCQNQPKTVSQGHLLNLC